MWKPHNISEQNKSAFQELCLKFQRNPSVFQCRRSQTEEGQTTDKRDDDHNASMPLEGVEEPQRKKAKTEMTTHAQTMEEPQEKTKAKMTESPTEIVKDTSNTQSPGNTTKDISNTKLPAKSAEVTSNAKTQANIKNGTSNVASASAPDIKVLQKKIITSLTKREALKPYDFPLVKPEDICKCEAPSLTDDALMGLCETGEKYGGLCVALLGNFILLPKLYHLPTKLAIPVQVALNQLTQRYTEEVVETVLVPLLRLLPTIRDQHKEMLAHCVPGVGSHHIITMLSTLSTRDHPGSENDFRVLEVLCQHCSPASPDIHTPTLACLSRLAPQYTTNVGFGQCLLYVIKNIAKHFENIKTFMLIVDSHKSRLRKVIDIAMRKIGYDT